MLKKDNIRGGSRGLGGQDPPPLLGDPKTLKRGENVVRVRVNAARLVLNS